VSAPGPAPGPAQGPAQGTDAAASVPGLATFSPGFARQLRGLEQVAPSDLAILIRGATGTGKERVARAIHELSGRTGPLVPVNCGSLSATLVESELFGYRRGAFSGALDDR